MTYVFKCPGCGTRDAGDVQMCLPAWFDVTFDSTGGLLCIGDLIDTDYEARANIFCNRCSAQGDEREFVEEIPD